MKALFKQALAYNGHIYSPRSGTVEIPKELAETDFFKKMVADKLVIVEKEEVVEAEKPMRGRRSNEE